MLIIAFHDYLFIVFPILVYVEHVFIPIDSYITQRGLYKW